MITRVLPPLIWHIFQIIVDSFGLVIFVCILNQSKVHWLLSDVLNSTISMSLKSKDEIDSENFDNIMEEDTNLVFEL